MDFNMYHFYIEYSYSCQTRLFATFVLEPRLYDLDLWPVDPQSKFCCPWQHHYQPWATRLSIRVIWIIWSLTTIWPLVTHKKIYSIADLENRSRYHYREKNQIKEIKRKKVILYPYNLQKYNCCKNRVSQPLYI
jgi:hypothetical protein